MLNEEDFEILARVIEARRKEHGFLAAWVFLPDHWHAIEMLPSEEVEARLGIK